MPKILRLSLFRFFYPVDTIDIPIFGLMVKFRGAPKTPSIVHINMSEANLNVLFFESKEGGRGLVDNPALSPLLLI